MSELIFPASEKHPGFSEGELVIKADYFRSEIISFRNSLSLNFTFRGDANDAYFMDIYVHMNKAVPPSLIILKGEDNKEIRLSLCRDRGLLTLEKRE